MSDSMFAIGYFDVGETLSARKHVERVMRHVDLRSHMVFYETPAKDKAPHFITGAGIFLL